MIVLLPSLPYQIQLAATSGVLFFGLGQFLAKRHSDILYTLIYLYALTVCLTLAILVVATAIEIFDQAGATKSIWGTIIFKYLQEAINLKQEMLIVAGLYLLVLAPPSVTYLIMGIFGYAVWRNPFGWLLNWLIYAFIKFLIVMAGTAAVTLPWIAFHRWLHIPPLYTVFLTITTLSFFDLALLISVLFFDRYVILSFARRLCPALMKRAFLYLHRGLARNRTLDA